MTGKKRKETARALLEEFLPAHGYELYNIKYVKDAGDWCLQVYIDKAGIPEGEYIGTADCELVSRYLDGEFDGIFAEAAKKEAAKEAARKAAKEAADAAAKEAASENKTADEEIEEEVEEAATRG